MKMENGQARLYGGVGMDNCIVCQEKGKLGYYLYHSFICTDCEQKMIETDPKDPRYQFFIDKLRVIREERMIM